MATSTNSVARPFEHMLPASERLIELGVRFGVTLLVGLLVRQLLFLLVARVEHWIRSLGHQSDHSRQRAETIGQTLRNLATVMVGAAVILHSLAIFGWDVRPLLAGAGILGVALGFGAQTLVRDVIAGMFIIFEDQFGIGDLVEVNGRIASVEELTVRSATLRDFNGYLLFVPNGEMKVVVNRSRGWNRIAVDLPAAVDAGVRSGQSDLDRPQAVSPD
ncbi:MAG: mechanosensitive ion channel [Candidatus Eisenbacteria bacterium]|uniref:Mechanosensitive ion channel n=1 Tax=Eiseniibacteriota bacterium TaxID=2212470 RepID=A0A849SXD9_UNCEI|nr:mechanosensitive ion channel [Candidatus Eisenbacteria bacterium]